MSRQIAHAANTIVPALLALEGLGYRVSRDGDMVVATSADDERFVAADPVAVLGLVNLVETRTWDWKATDEEIDATLQRYRLSS